MDGVGERPRDDDDIKSGRVKGDLDYGTRWKRVPDKKRKRKKIRHRSLSASRSPSAYIVLLPRTLGRHTHTNPSKVENIRSYGKRAHNTQYVVVPRPCIEIIIVYNRRNTQGFMCRVDQKSRTHAV